MATFVAYCIARSIPTIFGAFYIDMAVHSFKDKRYFTFGVLSMLTCGEVVALVRIIMKG